MPCNSKLMNGAPTRPRREQPSAGRPQQRQASSNERQAKGANHLDRQLEHARALRPIGFAAAVGTVGARSTLGLSRTERETRRKIFMPAARLPSRHSKPDTERPTSHS
jgi:hypothetical protein